MARRLLDLTLKGHDPTPRTPVERPLFSLESVTIAPGQGYDLAWDGQTAYLAVHDIVNRDGEIKGDDIPLVQSHDIRRRLTFVPEGLKFSGWCVAADRLNSFTALYFDQEQVFEQLEIAPSERTLRPFFHRQDRALFVTLQKLTESVRDPATSSQLLADSLALMAAAEAINSARSMKLRQGGLSDTQLSRATDYMEAHIADDVTLDGIASACGLSAFHFNRAFKQSTGVSPYRYLLEERMNLAKAMLAGQRDRPIADIAEASGFRSASHFSHTFHDLVGMSPRAYRQQVRG